MSVQVGEEEEEEAKNKVKALVVDVIAAVPLNPHAPLRIFEPTEGVTIASLPTLQAIFKGGRCTCL